MSKVILQGHILVPDNDLKAVTQALVVHKELTLEEPGCIVFRVSQSTLQPHRLKCMKNSLAEKHSKPINSA